MRNTPDLTSALTPVTDECLSVSVVCWLSVKQQSGETDETTERAHHMNVCMDAQKHRHALTLQEHDASQNHTAAEEITHSGLKGIRGQ